MRRLAALVGAPLIGLLAVSVGLPLTPPAAAAPGEELAPIMLVLDASGSMAKAAPGGTKMTAAKLAVHTLVDTMPADARMGLTIYGASTGSSAGEKPAGCKDVKVVLPVGPIDKAAITAAADAAQPHGYTPIGQALRTAADALPKEGPRAVVLVSDGEDTCAPPDPCEVAKELAKQGVELRVHTVGYQVDAKAKAQLTCIAQATGGTYTNVPDASALGQALTRVTSSAVRNYQPAGTPVTGTPTLADAPVVTPGGYLDTLGFVRKRYYAVDIPEGYTAYFAATVPSQRGGSVQDLIGLNLAVHGVGGESCNAHENEMTTLGGDGESVSTLLVWNGVARDAVAQCRKPGRYTFVVYLSGAGDHGSVTADEAERLPVELQVGLEPPVSGDAGPAPDTKPVAFADPGGPERPVTGGGSFGTAATLPGTGRYAEPISFGEIVYYRIRVQWGQSLAYRVQYRSDRFLGSANVSSDLYSPARGTAAWDTNGYTGGGVQSLPSADRDAFATLPVRYRNREVGNDPDIYQHRSVQSVAGWYYISVKLGRNLFRSDGNPPVSLTLTVSLTGTPEKGPEYANAAGDDTFGSTGNTVPAASPSPTVSASAALPKASNKPVLVGWVIAGSAGGGVLAVGAVAIVLLARRRRTTRPDGSGPSAAPGQ
jgi:Ca-activated chloride channel homolog